MTNHIFIPFIDLEHIELLPEYGEWLSDWMGHLDQQIENEDISSSSCLMGLLIELVINKKPCRDWDQIFSDLLTDDEGNTLAYSETYGKRLHNFQGQWKQTTVHSIYNDWWVNIIFNSVDHSLYADKIISLIQDNGWMYNPRISPTRIKTRMKAELMMSLSMGTEILSHSKLSLHKEQLEANCVSEPMTNYISAEYFRLKALGDMESTHLKPNNLDHLFEICKAGSGYCDFFMGGKIDDYMGSAKRSDRDEAVHSAISTLQAYFISNFVDEETKNDCLENISNFVSHLYENPFDIPSFKIRDILIPFGDDITPLELLSAGALMTLFGDI